MITNAYDKDKEKDKDKDIDIDKEKEPLRRSAWAAALRSAKNIKT